MKNNDKKTKQEYLVGLANRSINPKNVPQAYLSDRDIQRALLIVHLKTKGSLWFEDIPKEFLCDREVQFAVLERAGRYFEDFAKAQSWLSWWEHSLRDDLALGLHAVKHDWRAYFSLSKRLQRNRTIMFAAVKNSGSLLLEVPEFHNDKEIFFIAMQSDGRLLQYAHPDIQDDAKFVLAAVKNFGSAIQYASERLQQDEIIARAAVLNNGFAYRYLPQSLQNNRELALLAVKTWPTAFSSFPSIFKDDLEFVYDAMLKNSEVFLLLAKSFQENIKIVLLAMKNGISLEVILPQLRDEEEVIFEAMQYNLSAIQHLSELRKQDKVLALEIVRRNGLALQYLSWEWKSDLEVIMVAYNQNPKALQFAEPRLQSLSYRINFHVKKERLLTVSDMRFTFFESSEQKLPKSVTTDVKNKTLLENSEKSTDEEEKLTPVIDEGRYER